MVKIKKIGPHHASAKGLKHVVRLYSSQTLGIDLYPNQEKFRIKKAYI